MDPIHLHFFGNGDRPPRVTHETICRLGPHGALGSRNKGDFCVATGSVPIPRDWVVTYDATDHMMVISFKCNETELYVYQLFPGDKHEMQSYTVEMYMSGAIMISPLVQKQNTPAVSTATATAVSSLSSLLPANDHLIDEEMSQKARLRMFEQHQKHKQMLMRQKADLKQRLLQLEHEDAHCTEQWNLYQLKMQQYDLKQWSTLDSMHMFSSDQKIAATHHYHYDHDHYQPAQRRKHNPCAHKTESKQQQQQQYQQQQHTQPTIVTPTVPLHRLHSNVMPAPPPLTFVNISSLSSSSSSSADSSSAAARSSLPAHNHVSFNVSSTNDNRMKEKENDDDDIICLSPSLSPVPAPASSPSSQDTNPKPTLQSILRKRHRDTARWEQSVPLFCTEDSASVLDIIDGV